MQNSKTIAIRTIQKFQEKVDAVEDLKVGQVFKVLDKKLKKGRAISFNSELVYKKSRLGLIYQEAIKTHRQPSTYELSNVLPKQQRDLTRDLKKRGIKHFVIISNMLNSNFDGVSFEGLRTYIKLANSEHPNLLRSITILPKAVTVEVMYKLYSAIMPKIDGAKDVEGSIELVKKIASKLT